MGSRAPVDLLTNIAANSAPAFLVILAMTFVLILPRMLLETARDIAHEVQEPHKPTISARKRRKSWIGIGNSRRPGGRSHSNP